MRLFLIVIGVLVWLGAAPGENRALAQVDPGTCDLDRATVAVEAAPGDGIRELDRLFADDCLGAAQCSTPLCRLAHGWLADWRAADAAVGDTLRARAMDLLDRVRMAADGLPDEVAGVAEVQQRLASWNADRTQPLADQITALGEGIVTEWQYAGSLILFEGADDAVDAKTTVAEACEAAVAPADCARIFRTQAELLILARLQFTILSAFSAGQRAAFVRYLTGLEERWRRYHLDARANLPWELWLNGRLLAGPAAGRGFIEPPERQIILLHPIPLLVARGATTDDMAGALGIELIGLYAWRWEGTEMRSPWRGAPGFLDRFPLGGSLLMGFDGDDDPGLGLVAHLPRNWSIGAMIDRGGEVTAVVSVDVAKFFTDTSAQQRQLIEEFRKARGQ